MLTLRRRTLDMCWYLLIPFGIVSATIEGRDTFANVSAVGIYTDEVLDSYRGKNRLEVSEELPKPTQKLRLTFNR